MRYLLLTYILTCPLFYWVNRDMRTVQEWIYQVLGFGIIAGGLFFASRPVKKNLLNISLAVLFMWFLVVYCMYQEGWSVLLNLFIGLGVYMTIIRTMTRNDIMFLYRGFLAVLIIGVIHLGGQYCGYDLRGQNMMLPDYAKRVMAITVVPHCSFFGLKAAMGMYYALLFPIVISLSWVGLLMVIPLTLSYSTGAVLGVVCGMLFYYWFIARKLFWALLIPILVGGTLFVWKMDMPTGMFLSRPGVWKLVIQDIHKKPWGYGLDSFRGQKNVNGTVKYFKHSFNDTSRRVVFQDGGWFMTGEITADLRAAMEKGKPLDFWDHPHNEFVWVGYEAGIPSLIILGWVMWLIWKRFSTCRIDKVNTALMSSIVVMSVVMLTQFPFHLARIGHLMPIILGLFYVTTEDDRQETDRRY